MKTDHPILFNGDMVRAILDGRKTQTRRVIKPQPENHDGYWFWWKGDWDTRGGPSAGICTHGTCGNGEATWTMKEIAEHSPYGVPGDLLWAREPFRINNWDSNLQRAIGTYTRDGQGFNCRLTDRERDKWLKWKKPYSSKSSLFMFKSLARLWLKVKSVRVERVQNISDMDAEKEGCLRISTYRTDTPCLDHFRWLWNSINKKRGFGWDVNPFVWVVEFERSKSNE